MAVADTTYRTGYAGTSYNWKLSITALSDSDDCPVDLLGSEDIYCKVYKETDTTYTVYFHFRQPVRRSALEGLHIKGLVLAVPWIGAFWPKVDCQLKAKRIWELGTYRPTRRECNKRPRSVNK